VSNEIAKILRKCMVIRRQVELFIEQNKEQNKQEETHRDCNKLVNRSSLAFIIATICDQQINYKIAWEGIPNALYEWLREQGLDFRASVIYRIGVDKLRGWFRRYMMDKWPERMRRESREKWLEDIPRYIIETCEKIWREYNDDPDSIFIAGGEQLSIPLIYFMLRQFPGIGPKKASMIAREFALGGDSHLATCLIERLKGRGVNIKVTHIHFTEIPIDVHVKMVFRRLGFSRYGEQQDFQNLARIIYPENPGLVDLLIWNLGREVCEKHKCQECPLNNICEEYSKQFKSSEQLP
jgi:endonuclease III